jgi:hypothetical protein
MVALRDCVALALKFTVLKNGFLVCSIGIYIGFDNIL